MAGWTMRLFSVLVLLCWLHTASGGASSRKRVPRALTLFRDTPEQQQQLVSAEEPVVEAAAVAVAAAGTCTTAGTFEWPAGSGFCWFARDSNSQVQGPGSNVWKSTNVAVNAAGQLELQIAKDARKKYSCGEVFLNMSLAFGDYVFVVETDPALIHANLVASGFIYASDVNEFDVEFSRWGQPGIENSQFVIQPYATSPPARFNVSAVRLTHRIRWSGSNSPADVLFETFNEAGALVRSWAGTSGNNFRPGSERFHLNHWIYQSSTKVPDVSKFVVNCFTFCPLGGVCATPAGVKPACGASASGGAAATTTNPPSTPAPSTTTTQPVIDLQSLQPAPATSTGGGPCPAGSFQWPANTVYCWYSRDSSGQVQGPGTNSWSSSNAFVSTTGHLVLKVAPTAGASQPSSSGVFSHKSYGYGDYIFVMDSDPATIDANLVGGLALYSDATHSFAYEFSRWGQPSIENSQNVMQPYQINPPFRFNVSATKLTHRLRWSGGDKPSQVVFETYTASGALVKSWTGAAGGNNFTPGNERVHINHWMFQAGANLGATGSNFVLSCFKFVPLGQEASGSSALGTKPGC